MQKCSGGDIVKATKDISTAELEIMEVLWSADKPLSIQTICDGIADDKWKYNTVGTMLLRLAEKGIVSSQKVNRVIHYSPILMREEYKKEQTSKLISRLYGGSARDLAASLIGNGDVTKEDIDELRKLFNL